MEFHIPAGDASTTLVEFARQSGVQLVYLIDKVRGQRTAALEGRLPVLTALEQMLSHCELAVHRDPKSGAMIVVPGPRHALPVATAPRQAPEPASAMRDEIVKLPEFTVSTPTADRYHVSDAVSAVRVRAGLLDTPSSISVMPRDVFDDVGAMRLFDVTRYIAGIEDGRGIQFADRQIIRGFESNGRTVDNFFQSGADNIDEAVIDRVEVSKGPNAILAPAGVPGGSINVITKSPTFVRHNVVTGVVGLFDAQKLTLDLTGPVTISGPVAYRLVAAAQDSRRYWAVDARLRGKLLAPMATWRITPQAQLTVKLIAAEHWIFREPGLILAPGVSAPTESPVLAPGFSYRSRNGIQPWSHVGTHTADLFTLFTAALGDRIALRIAGNGRYYYEDSTQEFFSTPSLGDRYNPYTGLLTPDYIWTRASADGPFTASFSPYFAPHAIPVRADTQQTTITTTNAQADVATRRQIGTVGSETVVGMALTHFDSVGEVRSGALPPLNLASALPANPVWAASLYGDLRTRQSTTAWYVNERLVLFNEHIQVSGGVLRYSVIARSHDHVVSPDAPRTLDDSRWLGLGSFLVKPEKNLVLYYTHSTNSTPVIANSLSFWRDGKQDEVGLKTQFFHERLSFTAAAYRIRQTNVTVPNPDHQTDPSAPEQLISDLSDHGTEFEVTGGLTPNLSVIGAYTRLRLRDSLGRPVRAVADQNFALLMNYHWSRRFRPSVFAGVTYAGARTGDATSVNFTPLGVPTQPSFRIPGLTLVNLGGSLRLERWLLRLNLDNVFDVKNRLEQAGGRVSGTGLTTASGLNLKLSAAVEF